MTRLGFLTAGVLWLFCAALVCAETPGKTEVAGHSKPSDGTETPLYEEEPYDQVTLDAANNYEVVKIVPLKLPTRLPPPRGRPMDKLVVRRLDEPDKEYTILWRQIDRVELFEQLILKKANELVAAKRFEDAFDYFTYLDRNKPGTPGLKAAAENALYEEAKYCHVNGQYDGALALLREIRLRNARRPGLDVAIGRTTDELVKRYIRDENYEAARALLRNLASDYPEHPVFVRWRSQLSEQAAPLLAEARAAADAGQWAKAGDFMRRIAVIWPQLPGARDLALTVHRKCPRVVVGVGTLAGDILPNRLDDWAIRRTSRLLYRTLAEFAGSSAEGGRYDCPVGDISLQELNRRMAIHLKGGVCWASGTATLSNTDVAKRLLAMANPSDPTYRADWADLMTAVSTRGVFDIEVELRRPHVRPEAMLQIVVTPHGDSPKPGQSPPVNGPFIVASRSDQEVKFAGNAQYFASRPTQPREIVERRYPTVAKAILALKRGEVNVLDRVNPWNVRDLRNDPHFVVQPYAVPLIHCLVPNVRRPFMSDRNLRRAILYGIAREEILKQMLGGVDVPGCVVTSSPFNRGIEPGDPMGYASDISIEPRPNERTLAGALATVALKSYNKAKNTKLKSLPPIILAHPSDEIAKGACASIKLQLELLKIPIELRVIEGPMPTKVPDDVDLLYAELPMWEPLVDARRVLGDDGMTGGCSSYMTLALRQLDEAVDWSQVRDCLQRVHRISFDDAAILPLWQLVEYFAYHESLGGIPAKPVSLYQNIEQWKPPFQYPTEK
jgi:tetratricopeptide (TPR) repeat protein